MHLRCLPLPVIPFGSALLPGEISLHQQSPPWRPRSPGYFSLMEAPSSAHGIRGLVGWLVGKEGNKQKGTGVVSLGRGTAPCLGHRRRAHRALKRVPGLHGLICGQTSHQDCGSFVPTLTHRNIAHRFLLLKLAADTMQVWQWESLAPAGISSFYQRSLRHGEKAGRANTFCFSDVAAPSRAWIKSRLTAQAPAAACTQACAGMVLQSRSHAPAPRTSTLCTRTGLCRTRCRTSVTYPCNLNGGPLNKALA